MVLGPIPFRVSEPGRMAFADAAGCIITAVTADLTLARAVAVGQRKVAFDSVRCFFVVQLVMLLDVVDVH